MSASISPLYHGTGHNFDKFEQSKSRIINDFYGGGVAYFTNNEKVARTYAISMARKSNSDPIIYKTKLKVSKLFDVDKLFTGAEILNIIPSKNLPDVESFLKGAGLLKYGVDKYTLFTQFLNGKIPMTGDMIFYGLSGGMVHTKRAREHLIKKGYDCLRYNGGVNMNMATKHDVYISWNSRNIEILKKEKLDS